MRLTLLIIVCAIASAIFLAIPYVSLSQTTLKQNQVTLQQPAPAPESATAAQAGDHKFCTDFANNCLTQNARNKNLDCKITGGFWQSGFKHIYDWCLKNGKSKARKIFLLRVDSLKSCNSRSAGKEKPSGRGGSGSSNLGKETQSLSESKDKATYCRDYANKAIDQQKENQRNDCGLHPVWEWHKDFKLHYNWCMKKDRKTSRLHRAQRNQSLLKCRAKKAAKDKHTAYCRGGGNMRLVISVSDWGGFTGFKRSSQLTFNRSKTRQVQQLKPGECMLSDAKLYKEASNWFIYDSPRGSNRLSVTIGKKGVESYSAHSFFVDRIVSAMRNNDIFSLTVKYKPKDREYYIVDMDNSR
jgi:hypothetical protein